ncbi:hypothetical protein M434DRAFT_395823 [Hypoxylon sp. CO27-5]|nr:hypothetical protein M434DRAFT_395823 [Hypoxylon sp. CO27-5]
MACIICIIRDTIKPPETTTFIATQEVTRTAIPSRQVTLLPTYMSVSPELMADPDPHDKQPKSAAMDKNDSSCPVASPKAATTCSPKGILRKRTIDGEMVQRKRGRKTSIVAFANELGGDLAGVQIPEKTRSRDEWLWLVNLRRGSNMIELFRAQEMAEKSLQNATRDVEGKYRDGVWDVVLWKAPEDSDDSSSDDDEDDDAEEENAYDEENDEDMVGAEGIEIVFEAWIDEDADHRPMSDEGNEDEEMDDDSSDDDDDDNDDDQDDEETENEDGDDMTMTPSSSPSREKSPMLEPH